MMVRKAEREIEAANRRKCISNGKIWAIQTLHDLGSPEPETVIEPESQYEFELEETEMSFPGERRYQSINLQIFHHGNDQLRKLIFDFNKAVFDGEYVDGPMFGLEYQPEELAQFWLYLNLNHGIPHENIVDLFKYIKTSNTSWVALRQAQVSEIEGYMISLPSE